MLAKGEGYNASQVSVSKENGSAVIFCCLRSKPESKTMMRSAASGRIPPVSYTHLVYGDGKRKKFYDPYAFEKQISVEQEQQFAAGICYDIYEKLGAHPMTLHGVEGVYFAV